MTGFQGGAERLVTETEEKNRAHATSSRAGAEPEGHDREYLLWMPRSADFVVTQGFLSERFVHNVEVDGSAGLGAIQTHPLPLMRDSAPRVLCAHIVPMW